MARSRPLGRARIRSASRAAAPRDPPPYAFLPVEGEGLHQIPVGPVHAGIIEPGHFRFTANGETVVRLEERLGYVHKGIDGADARRRRSSRRRSSPAASPATARSPMRFAFARAVEAALGIEAPPRAHMAARADGRARAPRQPFRRHRRDLQRRLVRADACAMRHPARARAARGRRLLRPPADDGPHRAGRRRRRSRRGRRRRGCARCSREIAAALSRSWSSSTTTPPRCRTAPSTTGIAAAASWRGSSAPAAMSAAPRAAPSMRAATLGLCALRRARRSTCRCSTRRRRRCARLDPHPRGRAEPRR